MRITVLASALALALASPREGAAQAFFAGIVENPAFTSESSALGVSGDGSRVVGQNEFQPVVWTREGGLVPLELLGRGLFGWQGGVADASWDGSVVVGATSVSRDLIVEAARWIDGEAELLGVPTSFLSVASGVSDDGSVIVGSPGFRWTGSGVESLDMNANGVSADGSTVVGYRSGAAVRWSVEDGVVELLPDGQATAASSDGAVIVGYDGTPSPPKPFRWTEGAGVHSLGDIGGLPLDGQALDVTSDGEIVVGWAFHQHGGAFVWDALNGTQSLADYLETEHGLDLQGWDLRAANAVSADGRTIVGVGNAPGTDSDYENGWVVVLPHRTGALVRVEVKPGNPFGPDPFGRGIAKAVIFGATSFDVHEVDLAALALGPGEAHELLSLRRFDVDRDGHRDLVSYFVAVESGIPAGASEACVAGATLDGMPFGGCDGIAPPAACGHGAGLVGAVPMLWMLRRRRERFRASARRDAA